MDDTTMCARPLSRQDAAALIGITSMLGGELMLGQLSRDLERHLRVRLTRDGLLGAGETGDVTAALEALAQRLHETWGGADDKPTSSSSAR
jgi:hypothetical protein